MKNFILVLLGLLVIGGGAYYWYTTRETGEGADTMMTELSNEEMNTAEESTNTAQDSAEIEGTASFSATTLEALMAMGRNLSCNFTHESDGTMIAGVFNVSGQKMAGDYNITAPNGTVMNAKMVSDGQYMYSWGDAMPGMGVKIDLTKAKEMSNEATSSGTTNDSQPQLSALGQPFDYSCSPWSADPAAFEVPSNVNFLSL